jgi:hypothetical protein
MSELNTIQAGSFRAVVLLPLLIGAASICGASPITYSVNQTVGAGSVSGFIETDGTIGTLTTANILNWNLC